jgi:hypothetical protein
VMCRALKSYQKADDITARLDKALALKAKA